MAYAATVLRVMIASPSDTPSERDAVERAMHDWNSANAASRGIVLQPWRWETSSVPLLGGSAQSLINAQGVDDSDVVVALFGSRLGSPTAAAVFGTVEEIQRAVAQGKRVHLYFSVAPLPRDVDLEQLQGLRKFRDEIGQLGLLGQFNTVDDLERQVRRAIKSDVGALGTTAPAVRRDAGAVNFEVQPGQERELSDYDKNGKPRYRTRSWIDVKNTGDQDAHDVVFESVGEGSRLLLISASGGPTVIHAGQTRRVPVTYIGGTGPEILGIRWTESGEPKEREFHVG